MEQLSNLADPRLITNCIYCGSDATTRDHVPSKSFLERPYPENLPVVGACHECNKGFSLDEQYLTCLLEVVLAGTTDPEKLKRRSIAQTIARSPALKARIESSKRHINQNVAFAMEIERVRNVMLKLARGHAAFELSQIRRDDPDHFWFGSLDALSQEERELFFLPHKQELFGEIGSRNTQRLYVVEAQLQAESGEITPVRLLLNDWVDVQDNYYRYIAIDDVNGVLIRIVISEHFACEVLWSITD